MTDETKPKRMRGLKEREEAYRAGFLAGLEHAHKEIASQRALEAARGVAVATGIESFLAGAGAARKRTRRTRDDKEAERRGDNAERVAFGQAPLVERSA
jgi:hypothetical protein